IDRVRVVASDPGHSVADLHNTGLAHARGDYVTFVDGRAQVDPEQFAMILEAHDRGCAVVGAPVAVPRAPASTVAHLLMTYGSDDEGGGPLVDYRSFQRDALMSIGGFDQHVDCGFLALAARVLIGTGLKAAVVPPVG